MELSLEAHEVSLRPGETYRLDIGGLGSAGYGWSYEVRGPSDIVTVSLDAGAPPPRPASGAPPNSFSVSYTLSVLALRDGNTTVHLSLQRAGEKDKPPLRAIDVHVTVERDR
jgi:hypothetical protein